MTITHMLIFSPLFPCSYTEPELCDANELIIIALYLYLCKCKSAIIRYEAQLSSRYNFKRQGEPWNVEQTGIDGE